MEQNYNNEIVSLGTYINVNAWKWKDFFVWNFGRRKSINFPGTSVKLHGIQGMIFKIVQTSDCCALTSSHSWWIDYHSH